MNICFLDLDGVLNSQLYYQSDRFTRESNSRIERWLNEIDPVALGFLNNFVEETDSKIVLTSTWRDTAFEERILYHRGFKGEIIDVTPTLRFKGVNSIVRGNEIYQWLWDNQDLTGCYPNDFKKYVIFDDDSDMLLWQKDHFFLVDSYSGLTFNTTYRAKRFLDIISNR